jgi:hypothetical protein
LTDIGDDEDFTQWTFRELNCLASYVQTRDVELDSILAKNNRGVNRWNVPVNKESSWFQQFVDIPEQLLTFCESFYDNPIVQFCVFFMWFIIIFRGIFQLNALL